MKLLPGLFLAVFSFLVLSCASPVRSFQKAIASEPYDVVIVPGIPYEAMDWSSNIMKDRVVWSCYLYTRGIARNIIYSGNAVYTPYVEGRIMAMHARAMGIPAEHVFSETKAQHSTENLVYSYSMARKLGFKKIALATDPFQSATLKSYAWDYGIKVSFIPILYDSLNLVTIPPGFHVDPSGAFVSGFISLPQRENILKRFIGTLGIEIKPVTE
jgi:uncharacterized SAM-binding protein YcdF (DUF218 family)